MFCPKCGKEIDDTSITCNYCGQPVTQNVTAPEQRADYNESKTGMGILLGLLLNLIGLIVGVCLYPEGTVARKTFIKAWVICFIIEVVASAIISIVLFATGVVDTIHFFI